jgi:hypothetical protein
MEQREGRANAVAFSRSYISIANAIHGMIGRRKTNKMEDEQDSQHGVALVLVRNHRLLRANITFAQCYITTFYDH